MNMYAHAAAIGQVGGAYQHAPPQAQPVQIPAPAAQPASGGWYVAPVGQQGAPAPYPPPQQQPAQGVSHPQQGNVVPPPPPPRPYPQAANQHHQGYAQPPTVPVTTANQGGGSSAQQQILQQGANVTSQGNPGMTYNHKLSPDARSKAIRRIHSKLGNASEPVFVGLGGGEVETSHTTCAVIFADK
ncbi:unnamed protein product, partial [Sphacelaria rigidula]